MLLFSPQLQFSQRTIASGKIDQKILSISLNLVRLFIQSGLIIIHTVSCFDRLTQIPHKTFGIKFLLLQELSGRPLNQSQYLLCNLSPILLRTIQQHIIEIIKYSLLKCSDQLIVFNSENTLH